MISSRKVRHGPLLLLLLLPSVVFLPSRTDGLTNFLPAAISHRRQGLLLVVVDRGMAPLYMVAKKRKSNQKAKTTPNNKNNNKGGFGGGSSSSTTGSSSSSAAPPPQVRSVTGHTGSGTKPLRQAANTFDALRKEFGIPACRDVYVRAPLNDPETFWFVGKIAIRLDNEPTNYNTVEGEDDNNNNNNNIKISPEMAIWSQKRLILEYAQHQLRPQNLAGKFTRDQEIWLAPGDSEMDVVQNKLSLQKVNGSASDLPAGFVVKNTVGFNPEIYVGDEIHQGGLRVKRDPETGHPIKPVFEVNQSV